jgi:hypothetical protein
MLMGAATFNLFYSFLAGLLMFLGLYGFAWCGSGPLRRARWRRSRLSEAFLGFRDGSRRVAGFRTAWLLIVRWNMLIDDVKGTIAMATGKDHDDSIGV